MTCRYFGISRQLYYVWLRRYREEGVEGLRDRSRRPKVSPRATPVEVVVGEDHPDTTVRFDPSFGCPGQTLTWHPMSVTLWKHLVTSGGYESLRSGDRRKCRPYPRILLPQ
jgi:hypothetical protein